MTRYAMFLRGINVGGVKVPMAELRTVLAGMGAREVKTWLASGNIAMDWEGDAASLRSAGEATLSRHFSYTAHSLVLPFGQLIGIVDGCPFEPETSHHRYVVLCETEDLASRLVATAAPLDDAVEQAEARGQVVYWRCPKGSSLDTAFAIHQSHYSGRDSLTVRNLNTLQRMVR